MSGRARIGGLSCLQHVWQAIQQCPTPACIHDVCAATADMGFTRHMIDHHLRRLHEIGAVRRVA
jgi:hypothetical protein